MINRFIGKYKVLSNFEPAFVTFEGLTFPTVEHAYVAAKSLDKKFRRDIALMGMRQAGLAKKWGRTATLRSDWEKIKVDIMEMLLLQKFNPEKKDVALRYNVYYKVLKETGDELLVEGNFWHDNFWGNCICENCIKIEGKNQLGVSLMKVREFYALKKEGIVNLEISS